LLLAINFAEGFATLMFQYGSAEETSAAIKARKFNPFKCPVLDQDGKAVECKDGKALSDAQITSMNWYVKGIDEKLPK
jgi:simple sugar transport system substrate-binding protein